MAVFDLYAAYYDLLYRDKDYHVEAAFIRDVLQRHRPQTKRLLELGCGTGGHARYLADLGFQLHGVDQSENMVDKARLQAADHGQTYEVGDLRDVRVGRTFDAAISIFHVFSYLNSNADFMAGLASAHAHLEPGGLLLFDYWYGPAVLTQYPETRTRKMTDERIQVYRIAVPTVHTERNVVDVGYELFITDRSTGQTTFHEEMHPMRYFFLPELESYLQAAGFRVLEHGEWLTGKTPSPGNYGAYVVAARCD